GASRHNSSIGATRRRQGSGMLGTRDAAAIRHVAPQGLWAQTATSPSPVPELNEDIRADVAIIGAGFCGLSAALHLAEAGVPAVVLEAELPGWGASGRNGGQVIAGLKLDP